MTSNQVERLLQTLDAAWTALGDAYAGLPEGSFGSQTRARRRLRLDTYGHYPEHTAAIRAWREHLRS